MIRAHSAVPPSLRTRHGLTAWGAKRLATVLVVIALPLVAGGCGIVPKSRMDECQRLTQTLRSENARLKDRILAVQGQNRDYAERAVDDARRLATQDDAIERLEHSVQAYQDTVARFEAAYKKLASNLGSPELSKDESRGRAQPSEMTRSFAPSPSRQTKATASLHSDDAPR
jgi:uncharacterized coiled-coil protein SlyX